MCFLLLSVGAAHNIEEPTNLNYGKLISEDSGLLHLI